MSKTKTNSLLLELTSLCMTVSKKHVEPYYHRNNPHKLNQAQLLTLLVLKAFLNTPFRGVIEFVYF